MNERVWRLLDFRGRNIPEGDIGAFTLQSEGNTFSVAISGPSGMTVRQMTDALRAALWYGGRAGGADLSGDLKCRLAEAGELTPPGKTQ